MSEDVNVQMAVLAKEFEILSKAITEDREANIRFHEETDVKLAKLQSLLDKATGGWKVLVVLGGFMITIAGLFEALWKFLGH